MRMAFMVFSFSGAFGAGTGILSRTSSLAYIEERFLPACPGASSKSNGPGHFAPFLRQGKRNDGAEEQCLVWWMEEHARASPSDKQREQAPALHISFRRLAIEADGVKVAEHYCRARDAVPRQRQKRRRQSGDWRSQGSG